MAPPKPPEEEGSNDSSTPSTPAKRKPSTPTSAKRKATPPIAARQAARAAVLHGPRTPTRKASANKPATPDSAPLRKTLKVPEPTLLNDFLLGRPSPNRVRNGTLTRRKSLDAVKAEMRVDNMARVQAPGKVNDRVKQWQRANAAAVVPDPVANVEIAVEVEKSSGDETVEEEDRQRIKHRGRKPNRRKSRSPKEEPPGSSTKLKPDPSLTPRSKSAAPKKRVISDSHWMNKKLQAEKGNAIPKNFLQATSVNPPVEKKIEDWVKRTESRNQEPVVEKGTPRKHEPRRLEVEGSDDESSRRGSSRHISDDSIRIKPSKDRTDDDDGIRIRPSRSTAVDDGIRIKPSKDRPNDDIRIKPSPRNLQDDDIRVRPSRSTSSCEDVEVKPARRDGSQKIQRRQRDQESESSTPRQRSEKHLRTPAETPTRRSNSQTTSRVEEDDDQFSWISPSQRRNSKPRVATPPESVDDIAFGNSAFSVAELPLGAEAGNIKRPTPKRNPSFMVPKVLKKVYNEIIHDNSEPPRGGPNQPPSIESWLNGTGDPFIDRPPPPASVLDIPESSDRRRSYNNDDQTEQELTAEHINAEDSPRMKSTQDSWPDDSPTSMSKTRDVLPSMETAPNLSPAGLKRSSARRNISSPKVGRKLPFKDVLIGAFQGESAMKKPAPSPYDYIGLREPDRSRVPSSTRIGEPENTVEEPPPKISPRTSEKAMSEPVKEEDKPLPFFPRRLAPTTGAHRLSTIASVETFSTSSSVSQTASDFSETTVTQDTISTAPTGSSLSRNSKKSTSKNAGLKRKLTKHSDLMSMLSLPDTTEPSREPGREISIRSARSVRTTRTNLENATINDLMREVAEDETKYMRELNTLVDGVIPVLLTSVLSKSDAAIAAGLYDPLASSGEDTAFTKPIVDMGIALEKLKSLHKRINLTDFHAFLFWAQSAQTAYTDYLLSWRCAYHDVVVNLASASPSQTGSLHQMGQNKDGDVITDTGERVDVAYLLNRPCVRVKKLSRAMKASHFGAQIPRVTSI